MTDNNDKINQLLDKLEYLLKRQDDLSREINILRIEVNKLKNIEQEPVIVSEEVKQDRLIIEVDFNIKNENIA